MRYPSSLAIPIWCLFVCVGVAWPGLSGCSYRQPPMTDESAFEYQQTLEASGGDPQAQADYNEPEALSQAVQQQAQRLSEAMAQRTAPQQEVWPQQIRPQRVQWLNLGRESASAASDRSPTKQITQTGVAVASAGQASSKPASDVLKASVNKEDTAGLLDRRQLLAQLRKAIQTGDDPAVDKAMAVAALSLADPRRELDKDAVSALDPAKRDQVRRYHRVIVGLAQDVASADGRLDEQAVLKRIDDLFGPQPMRVTNAELCRRVRGYGVYEPFESRVFLAGREHPVIVYAELNNYRVAETADQQYEVRLAQELVLYNESDGLAVWKQPRVEIVDQSRNRRRDFFVVQMIRLPARLNVGKYLLKVRITDQHGGSLDEVTLPIQVVADQSLVAGG